MLDGEESLVGRLAGPGELTIGLNGERGPRGYHYTPHMTEEGDLSWTNNGGLPNPETVNIMGPVGPQGEQGEQGETGEAAGFGVPTATAETLAPDVEATVSVEASGPDTAKVFDFEFGIPKGEKGEQGEQGDPGVYVGTVEPSDESVKVWINPNGTGMSVPIQYEELPTPSAELEGEISQYIGATTSNYTQGYYYQVVSDGAEPATYSWEQINVQPETIISEDNLVFLGSARNYMTEETALDVDEMDQTKTYMLFPGIGSNSSFYIKAIRNNTPKYFDIKNAEFNNLSPTYIRLETDGTTTWLYAECPMYINNITNMVESIGYTYAIVTDWQRQSYSYIRINAVTTDTNQTITGKKTFSVLPESSVTPTTDNQLVNKKYVDENAGGSTSFIYELDLDDGNAWTESDKQKLSDAINDYHDKVMPNSGNINNGGFVMRVRKNKLLYNSVVNDYRTIEFSQNSGTTSSSGTVYMRADTNSYEGSDNDTIYISSTKLDINGTWSNGHITVSSVTIHQSETEYFYPQGFTYNRWYTLGKPIGYSSAPTDDRMYANKKYVDDKSIPTGGSTGQVLAKASNTDNDVEWINASSEDTIATFTFNTIDLASSHTFSQSEREEFASFLNSIYDPLTDTVKKDVLLFAINPGPTQTTYSVLNITNFNFNGVTSSSQYLNLEFYIMNYSSNNNIRYYAINVNLGKMRIESGTIYIDQASLGVLNDFSYLSLNYNKVYTPTGDYNPATKKYVDDKSIPSGGTTGQVLKKTSGTDYAVEWGDAGSGDKYDIPITLKRSQFSAQATLNRIGELITNNYQKIVTVMYCSSATGTAPYLAMFCYIGTRTTSYTFNNASYLMMLGGVTVNATNFVVTGSWSNNVFTASGISDGTFTPVTALSTTNTTSYTPTGNYHPATKKYVDDNITNIETQYATLPTASASNLGTIIQYVGETGEVYVNGMFYKCIETEETPTTYAWSPVESSTFTEEDPIFTGSPAAGISNEDITNWNNKLSSYTETDPIFRASPAYAIRQADINRWNATSEDTNYYSWNGTSYDFFGERYIDEEGNAGFGHFYNGGDIQ